MATAKEFNDWEDPGLAFTLEEMNGFDPTRMAEDRLMWLIELQNVMFNYWRICENGNVGARVWSSSAMSQIRLMCGHLCVAGGLEQCDPLDFDQEEKDFVVAAHEVAGPVSWVEGIITDTESFLRHNVTLGRRALIGRVKAERSTSNKVLHAVLNERHGFLRWQNELKKYSLKPED